MLIRKPQTSRPPHPPRSSHPPRRPRTAGTSPRRSSLLLGTAFAVLTAALPFSGTAVADDPSTAAASSANPSAPSAADVRAAQDTAAQRATEVAAVQAQLAAAQQAEKDLDIQAERAVEAYNGATVRRRQAEADSTAAAAASVTAAAQRETARQAAAALAAAQYRMGIPAGLEVVQGLMEVQDLHTAGLQEQALRAVQQQDGAVVAAATSTAAAAAAASAAAAQAATDARQAAARVQDRLAAQRTEVSRIDAQRTVLLAKLAAAQQTSVALAEKRQQALAAAAARAAAEAAAAAARQSADAAPSGGSTTPYRPGDASAAVAYARAQLGSPYVWGGAGPDVFDCSGLTMRAWQRAGVDLPHFAADQYARSTRLSYRQLRPGDLVFWSHDGSPQDIYHVALYLGDDRMIEAPRTGDVVKVASLWIMGAPDFYARPGPAGS